MNPLHAIDFYKADHRNQYPSNTQYVYSNLTPRSGKNSNTKESGIIFFTLQAFILKFLMHDFNTEFFNKPKTQVLNRYMRRMNTALGEGAITFEHIEALHDLGYLPLHIKALPEGSFVPYGVPVMTIVNTHPDFFWLTNYLESVISACVWKGCTSATTAFAYKKLFLEYARATGSPEFLVQFQGHDFSFRGLSGLDDALMSGMGHLTSFTGTDTVLAIDGLEDYYNGNAEKELLGCSVPATEHSVMCMGGVDNEIDTFSRLLDLYPKGIVSIVSDTWDFWKVITEYAPALKDKIMARKSITAQDGTVIAPGKTVFRPDSGDPVLILTGYKIFDTDEYPGEKGIEGVYKKSILSIVGKAIHQGYEAIKYDNKYYKLVETGLEPGYSEISEAEAKGAVQLLWEEFGGTITDKGYKLLDEHVGLIYGDSITLDRAKKILQRLKDKGFASLNTVLGIGSFTYEYVTRDTHGMAMKATWGVVDGEPREIFKDPKTDSGMKKSAKGLLRVEKVNGEYKLFDQQSLAQENMGELKTVYLDGLLINPVSIAEIRERIDNEIRT